MMERPTATIRLLLLTLGLLLTVFMTVEAAHNHAHTAGDQTDSHHCQLCMAAHTAVSLEPPPPVALVLKLIGAVSIGEVFRGSCDVVVTAFIRPPPSPLFRA